jgi:hypothetical protein
MSVFFVLGIMFFVVINVDAEINRENFRDFLVLGEMNYTITVTPDPAAQDEEAVYINNRRLPSREELERGELSVYRRHAVEEQNEYTALVFARAVLTQDADDFFDEAYNVLLPYLESGSARPSSVYTGMALRMAAEDYALAARIAEVYLTVYPRDARLYYGMFNASLAGNISRRVFSLLNAALEGFFPDGEAELTEENAADFFNRYWNLLSEHINIAALEKAVELDSSNFSYCLSAGFMKSMVLFFTKLGSLQLSENLSDEDILNILLNTGAEEAGDALRYLRMAEAVQPESDVKLNLAYATYYSVLGNGRQALNETEAALEKRPDLPEVYDALLYSLMMRDVLEYGEFRSFERAREVLEAKTDKSLGSAKDYYSLALLSHLGCEEENRCLEEMRRYLETSLEHNRAYFLSLLSMGTYHVLNENYDEALQWYAMAEDNAGFQQRASVLQNRGVTYMLLGKPGRGRAAFREALEIDPDNPKTLAALEETEAE